MTTYNCGLDLNSVIKQNFYWLDAYEKVIIWNSYCYNKCLDNEHIYLMKDFNNYCAFRDYKPLDIAIEIRTGAFDPLDTWFIHDGIGLVSFNDVKNYINEQGLFEYLHDHYVDFPQFFNITKDEKCCIDCEG